MKYLIILAMLVAFSGCTPATFELMYKDVRVVYQDTKYIVHEIQEDKK